MTKDQLEQVVLACIRELISQSMSTSQAELIIGFVDNLRQRAADKDQSDHFACELQRILGELRSETQ